MISSENVFELASLHKFRYSYKGEIATEDLWDLTLEELDELYRKYNDEEIELEARKTGGLLNYEKESQRLTEEIVIVSAKKAVIKRIFDQKKAEITEAAEMRRKADEKKKLISILERKENEELEGKSKEEILALINNL